MNRPAEPIEWQTAANQPLMDVERVRQTLLEWLGSLVLPASAGDIDWSDSIRIWPGDPGEIEINSGRRARLAVRLFTHQNRYVVSFIESLAPSSRGVYTLCCHVDWQDAHRMLSQRIEEAYAGAFLESLRAWQIIWAQTVTYADIFDALNHCAVAMLGYELTNRPPLDGSGQGRLAIHPQAVSFPRQDSD